MTGTSQTIPDAGERTSIRRLAPVRFVVFVLFLLVCDIASQLIRERVIRHVPLHIADWVSLALAIAFSAILIGIYIFLVRALEHRKAAEARPRPIAAVTGVVFGFGLFSCVFGLLWLMGIGRWHGLSESFAVIPPLAGSMVAAVGEELAFRGGAFRVLEDTFGTTAALAGSAALFGLLHLINPGATAASTLAIALEAGVLLASAYAFTRNLWLPIGIHFGWNFTEGGIYGVSVSGFASAKGVFSVALTGPTLLTGGKFGPEASVVAVGVTLAASIVLIVLTVRRGLWIPARARMRLD